MAERAQVTSVEALEAFRAQLILYLGRARAVAEEVCDEILRTRNWLEDEQRARWERECRVCQRLLEEAQQELFSTKISRLQTQTAAQVLAVEKAKRNLRHAEEKRDAVKRWVREFGNRAEPLGKQVEQLLTFLTTEMVKAVAHLGSMVRTLEAYAAIQPSGEQAPPSPATGSGPEAGLPSTSHPAPTPAAESESA